MSNSTTRTGSALSQIYTITNTSSAPLNFDLVRYFDGDLDFDGNLIDGGGRLVANGTEILFETDSATGSAQETTFIGITAEGGTIPTTNRFESGEFAELRGRIIQGGALTDVIKNDSADPDQFVDAGAGYDITPSLRNTFSLAAGQSANYTTQTIFGTGAPQQVIIPPVPPTDPPITPLPPSSPPTEIPFEFSPGLGLLLLGAWGAMAQLISKVQKWKSYMSALSKN